MSKIKMIFLLLFIADTMSALNRYVTVSGSGSMNGTSWSNAYPGASLQNAINLSNTGDEVWVSNGIYYPTTSVSRTASFNLKNGVILYGGFVGTEILLSQRNLATAFQSILSGNIGTAAYSDNSYHIIYNTGLNNTAVIDGFVITDGNANGASGSIDEGGAGIYNFGGFGGTCNPTIRNCIFRNHTATYGAAIFDHGSNGGNASPTISHCIFENNVATGAAGAIDNYGYSGNASPQIINCIFVNNSATLTGGAIHCWGGGAGNASPFINACTFFNNTANVGGGAVVADNQNTGVGFSGNASIVLLNCILYGNAAPTGPQFYIIGTATINATFSNIDVTGQTTPHVLSGAGTGNLTSVPSFLNPSDMDGADNIYRTSDDGLVLLSSSLNINSGNNTSAPAVDLKFIPRIVASTIDIGAYETNITTSVEKENKTLLFEIFPNPTHSNCTLNIDDAIPHILQIYDMQGTLLNELEINQKQILNLDIYPKGVYLIVIDKKFYNRIIKI